MWVVGGKGGGMVEGYPSPNPNRFHNPYSSPQPVVPLCCRLLVSLPGLLRSSSVFVSPRVSLLLFVPPYFQQLLSPVLPRQALRVLHVTLV